MSLSSAQAQQIVDLLSQILQRLDQIRSPVPNKPQFTTGQRTVQTSGQSVTLPNLPIPDGFAVIVKAMKANTGTITIGGNKGDASNKGTSHFKLAPNESAKLSVSNLGAIAIDATVSGEGVEYIVEQESIV